MVSERDVRKAFRDRGLEVEEHVVAALAAETRSPVNGAAMTGPAGRDCYVIFAGSEVVEWVSAEDATRTHDVGDYSAASVNGGCVVIEGGEGQPALCVYAKDE